MNYYALGRETCFSLLDLDGLIEGIKVISEQEAQESDGLLYYLIRGDIHKLKRCYCISQTDMLMRCEESINMMHTVYCCDCDVPMWISERIDDRRVLGVNINHPKYYECFKSHKEIVREDGLIVHILGLGDVGGTLLTGLRLLGDKDIEKIGIYDLNEQRIKRWEMEAGQIYAPFSDKAFPRVEGIKKDELFECDVFVFCASLGVPKVGDEKQDVRLVQYEGNSRILNIYGKMARDKGFKGLFAVVSDPVDMLCKSLYVSSNRDENGNMDYMGLAQDQIKGYGLGVMNARAVYYAKDKYGYFIRDGRAYGPHGKGLIIADNIIDYNVEASNYLTDKATNANIDIRGVGFKPFIAPALSSGALSILATIRGEWHYSTNYIDGVFMGCLNRNTNSGLEIERLNLPEVLKRRIDNTYNYLKEICE